jgi:hypothetical protein
MKKLVVVLLATTIAGSLLAQVVSDQDLSDPERRLHLAKYTCAEHVELVELMDGRTDVRLVWAWGYYSALKGIDENSPPIGASHLEEFAKKLNRTCVAEPEKLFITVVKEME